MKNPTVPYVEWSEVADYESDEKSVSLMDSSGNIIAAFDFPKFTKETLVFFQNCFPLNF